MARVIGMGKARKEGREMEREKRPLIILTGPTAVGKTDLSLRLARELDGDIVSADSMQVYRRMDIGTAKVTREEMEGIPHHLIDVLEPDEDFNVVTFVTMAREAMEGIYSRGRIPVVTGGTGFYIQALAYDVNFETHQESDYRRKLQALAEEKGADHLHTMLAEVDPAYAAGIHANNVKRVIRALEFHHETGMRLSDHNSRERERTSPYDLWYFVLNCRREVLYDRINRRVDQMMELGLEEEACGLIRGGLREDMTSMQGIGYREFFPYIRGEQSLDETIEQIKKDTRHFAKRQLTWFRREKDVIWINKEDYPGEDLLLAHMISLMDKSR